MDESKPYQQEIIQYIKDLLGDGMIDVELDLNHYTTAINKAFAKFRQRSQASTEESYAFLTLQNDTNDYYLPKEVMEVRQIFRRTIGSRTGGGDGGTIFEPFNLAYTNTYLLSSSNMGGLATYYAFASYQKLVGKMFGSDINFVFHNSTKKLTLMQRPRGNEEILLWIYNHRPEFDLINDAYAGIWIKDYALATCKVILGEAREKFQTIASPQGGTSLNGTSLKAEGKQELEVLELDLINYKDGSKPLTFVIG